MFAFGEISIIAILAFVLGKVWTASETVYQARQNAYLEVLRACRQPTEFNVLPDMVDLERDASIFQKVSPEITVYASLRVLELFNRLTFLIGWLHGSLLAGARETEEFKGKVDEANSVLSELQYTMRKDALSWSIFGIIDWFRRDRTLEVFKKGPNL